ncbi:type IV pilus twitching motility protein PilT [Silvibacterium sp.]|uniref:type IV pilus twitching motility protein PilT n=1 Tax=Silvibacterium sp. TaxID=1964179 RepID=UPI0039E5EC8E
MTQYDNELDRLVEQLNRSSLTPPRAGSPAKSDPAKPDPAKIDPPKIDLDRLESYSANYPERSSTGTYNDRPSLDHVLALAAQRNASDVLLLAGVPPTFRIKGTLASSGSPAVSPEDLRFMLMGALSPAQAAELEEQRSIDLSFSRGSIGRFRANFHYQRGTLAASIRLLPAQVPTIDSLHLPASLALLTEKRQGLILVTGPTGSGKTSTLAALLDLVNTRRHDHVITIEDPVEYQHLNRSAIIEQIEVGRDTPTFAHAVRAVLRQDPDVILIGEMRDGETMTAALTAAETGHLVLSSLHTNDASQALSRILDLLPSSHQQQIRQQLSLSLLAILSQQLLPAADRLHRYPAVEILLATPGIRNLIRTGHDHQIRHLVATGRGEGMQTMEQSLADLVQTGRITLETAYAHSANTKELAQYLGRELPA